MTKLMVPRCLPIATVLCAVLFLLAFVPPTMAQEHVIAVSPTTFSLSVMKTEHSSRAVAKQHRGSAGSQESVETVDWSPWVTTMSGRWHQNLLSSENYLGVRFRTQRAALIQFTCYADGHIGNVVLKQSSGFPLYDRLQISALLNSAPLPPFPKGTQRKTLTLTQGWESHESQPGEGEFEATTFASRFPQENVISKWALANREEMPY